MSQPVRRYVPQGRPTSSDRLFPASRNASLAGGSGGAAPSTGNSLCSKNTLLLLLVLVLVPANIYVFARTASPAATAAVLLEAENSAATGLRHVLDKQQPEKPWTLDDSAAQAAQAQAAVDDDDDVDDEEPLGDGDDEDDEAAENDEEFEDDAVGVIVKSPEAAQQQQLPIFQRGEPLPVQIPGYQPGKRKTFVYFRSKSCTHLCQRAKSVGWTPGILDFSNRIYPDMLMIRWTMYGKYSHLTKTLINQVGSGGSCIGGGKGIQLLCRQQLAARHGCEFGDLGVQPYQWNIQKQDQCARFFQTAREPGNEDKIWIMKPGGSFHGRGITLHRGNAPELVKTYGECRRKLPDGLIVQEYVMKPALMGGHKFDLRTYLLIASTKPYLVFYHDGFARRSSKAYSVDGKDLTDPLAHITNDARQSSENHFFGFAQLEDVLVREWNFPRGYFEQRFVPRAMRITNFLFHTAVDRSGHRLEPRSGRFQFFALDWMIDQDGHSLLLEGNGDPSVKHYPDTGLTPVLWESMFELVERVHFNPSALGNVAVQTERFRYKGWRLVYNQLEALAEPYEPCKINKYAEENHPLYGFNP